MKRAFATSSVVLITLLLIPLLFSACRSGGGDLSQAATQRRFGVRMAKMSLWREAMFRFRRATEIEPDNAMAHNNLAVAYEANGEFDAAGREYREALRLDRSNQHIQKNYSRYVEFTQRSKKREASRPAAKAPAAAATDTTATMTSPAQPPVTATDSTTTAPPVTDTTVTTSTNPPGEGAR